MLELDKQKSKLISVNPRAELHGEETKMAIDLHFEFVGSNDVLSHFDPFLKGALYKKGESAQGELIADASHLPVLRFPSMGPIKWDYVGLGYELTVHYGLDGKSDIKLGDLQVDKFKFTCKDGGSVITGFRVICHPSSSDTGRLCEMVGQIVDITLLPPEEDEQQEAA